MLDKKNFVPKELASYDGKRISHYIFKPPIQFSHLSIENKRQIRWLENNFHGLRWSVGWIDPNELSNILHLESIDNINIYVKGLEKTKYIQNYLGEIVKEYPSSKPALHKTVQKPYCIYHNNTFTHCAINNVISLYDHLIWSRL